MRGGKNKKRTDHKSESAGLLEQDENFYFIAGCTDGGFPYGITWEEYEAEQRVGSIMKERVKGGHMKELKLTKQQFQEIVDAYDMYVEGIESFLNIETGDVVTLRTFDRDEEDEELSEVIEEGFNEIYFRLPKRESDEGYTDMVDFAETVEDKKLQSTLMHILSGGKKIFRRFKDALSSDSEQLERYYQFVEEQNRKRVSDWLESIEVKLILE
ncbi:UPF0158 family protein [Paenibacillus validus]|jgi:hypothetical protein|uniref:UPF0158 family protein n=1 Tax=Paenibacillus validus TaxID=44253 RepID=UPI000FD8C55E|nr:UPF0158 family protein [Paenibacillus validus]MED4600196.1 UPF0158 family protein [Paenibacillus validus]MED4605197.1 UPF0158 family protein [Paenibacillus validus]